jgi:hypothetical protein
VDIEFEPVGFGFGDPHISTFDRLNFDFQVVGEFTLVEDDDDDLTIQARTSPTIIDEDGTESENASNYTAIGVGLGDETVAIYAGEDEPVYIDGEEVPLGALQTESTANGAINVTNLGDGFFGISLTETGEQIVVQSLEGQNPRVEPRISLSNQRDGNLTGVLGNKDGDPSNDIVAENAVIENPTFAQINGAFADNWRITDPADSQLLREDENLDEINDQNFSPNQLTVAPREIEDAEDTLQASLDDTLANLAEANFFGADEEDTNENGVPDAEEDIAPENGVPDGLDAIVDQVDAEGVNPGLLFNAAVVDLAVTGDESFLASARNAGAGNIAPEVENDVFRIEEDLANGEVVGTVSIQDADDGLENLDIDIIDGNTDVNGDGEAAFAIDGQGQITVNDSGDLAAEAGSDFSLTVEAVDPLGASGTGSITVVKDDPNEDQAPVVTANVVDNIAENSSVGTRIGTALAVNPDDPEADLDFALEGDLDVDGDGTNAFEISEDGVITVADAGDLNFEADFFADQDEPSLTFAVTATQTNEDPLTGSSSTVTVNLIDVEPEDGEPTDFDLDVDGSGQANGAVDGLNILRVLFGLNAETMDTSQAPDNVGQQNIFDNIEVGLEGGNPPLDVDGSGTANGAVDGLNILRVLFGLNAETMDTSQAPDNVGQQNIFDNVDTLIPGAEA